MPEFKPFNIKIKLEILIEFLKLFSERESFLKEQQIKTIHNYNDSFKIDDFLNEISMEKMIEQTYIDELEFSNAYVAKGQEIKPKDSFKRFKVKCFFETIEYKVLFINNEIYTLENQKDKNVFNLNISHYQNDSLKIVRT